MGRKKKNNDNKFYNISHDSSEPLFSPWDRDLKHCNHNPNRFGSAERIAAETKEAVNERRKGKRVSFSDIKKWITKKPLWSQDLPINDKIIWIGIVFQILFLPKITFQKDKVNLLESFYFILFCIFISGFFLPHIHELPYTQSPAYTTGYHDNLWPGYLVPLVFFATSIMVGLISFLILKSTKLARRSVSETLGVTFYSWGILALTWLVIFIPSIYLIGEPIYRDGSLNATALTCFSLIGAWLLFVFSAYVRGLAARHGCSPWKVAPVVALSLLIVGIAVYYLYILPYWIGPTYSGL